MKYKLGDLITVCKHNKTLLAVVLEDFFDTIIFQAFIEDSLTKKVYITNKEYAQKSLIKLTSVENINKESELYKTIKLKINLLKLGER